jgi:hypothetical protein
MRRLVPALVLLIAACSGQPAGPESLCELAADHAASCVGAKAPAVATTCEGEDAELAAKVMTTSCDQLTADDKGDGLSSGGGFLACVGLGVPIAARGLPEDALCCFDHNCEGELVCRKFRCEKKSALGGPCARENHCEGDLGCYQSRCAVKAAEGGRCDREDSCLDGLVCKDGRCRAPAADGGSCKYDHHCASYHCLGGRCVSPSPEGGVCGGTRGLCEWDLECVEGVCREPAASGAACDPSDFFACENGETCWQGICERRHEEGEACARLFDCDSGLFCRSGRCAP